MIFKTVQQPISPLSLPFRIPEAEESLHRLQLPCLLVLQNGLSETYITASTFKYLENAVLGTSLLAMAQLAGQGGGKILRGVSEFWFRTCGFANSFLNIFQKPSLDRSGTPRLGQGGVLELGCFPGPRHYFGENSSSFHCTRKLFTPFKRAGPAHPGTGRTALELALAGPGELFFRKVSQHSFTPFCKADPLSPGGSVWSLPGPPFWGLTILTLWNMFASTLSFHKFVYNSSDV